MWNGSVSGSDPHGATLVESLFTITISRLTYFYRIDFIIFFKKSMIILGFNQSGPHKNNDYDTSDIIYMEITILR